MDSALDLTDLNANLPTNSFSKGILKMVVGDQRANQVLNSMSMDIIPNVGGGSMGAGLKDSKLSLLLLSQFYRPEIGEEHQRDWRYV